MRLHIIRHGDPNYEKDCLTPQGIKEAEALVRFTETLPLRALYSSPMGRAQETAVPTAKRFGLPVTILPWAIEIGLPSYVDPVQGKLAVWNAPPNRLAACESFPGGWVNDPLLSPPAGELVLAKTSQGLQELLASEGISFENGAFSAASPLQDGDVALFCHFGLGLAALSILFGQPATFFWRAFFLATSSVTTVAFRQKGSDIFPQILTLGSTPHLLK